MLLLQSILKEVIEESRQSVPRFGNVRFDRIDLEKHLQKKHVFFLFYMVLPSNTGGFL